DILVGTAAPANDEGPDRFGFFLYKVLDFDDRLPPWVLLSFWSGLAWQNFFGALDGIEDIDHLKLRCSAKLAGRSLISTGLIRRGVIFWKKLPRPFQQGIGRLDRFGGLFSQISRCGLPQERLARQKCLNIVLKKLSFFWNWGCVVDASSKFLQSGNRHADFALNAVNQLLKNGLPFRQFHGRASASQWRR